jgi:hypothetical protein
VPAGEAENSPKWIAANAAVGEALAAQDDLALKLLETQPTTIAVPPHSSTIMPKL